MLFNTNVLIFSAKVVVYFELCKSFFTFSIYTRLLYTLSIPLVYKKRLAGFGITIGDLWDFYGLSVAFYKRVSIIMLLNLRHGRGFVPKIVLKVVIEILKLLPVPFESFHMLYGFVVNSKIGLHKFLRIMRF